MRKLLTTEPVLLTVAGVAFRTFQGTDDIEPWVALRERAFGNERISIRCWHYTHFQEEFLAKSWWRPEHLWLAFDDEQLVGAVTLAQRGAGAAARPAVHWLMVHPAHRRRGIAAALMSNLERAVWEAGQREIVLETHAAWTRAAAFYLRNGYETT